MAGMKLGLISSSPLKEREAAHSGEARSGSLPSASNLKKNRRDASAKVKREQFKPSTSSHGAIGHLHGHVSHLKGLREYKFRTTAEAIQTAGIVKKEYLGDQEIKFTSFAEIQSIKDAKIKNRLVSDIPSIDHLDKRTPKEALFHFAAAVFSKPEALAPSDERALRVIGDILSAQKPVALSRAEDNIHELALQYQYSAIESSIGEMIKSAKDLQGDRIKKLIYILENVTSSYVYGRIPGKPLKDEEYLTLLKIFLHLFEMIRGHEKLKFLIGSDAYTKLLLSKEYLDQASPMRK